ncbi:MAG: hypothetical protein ACYC4R_14370 [Anaerolineae bacterium]
MTGLWARHVNAFGWSSLALGNGHIEATIVPAIGGRIMSFRFDGLDFVWRNRALEGRLYSAAENQGDGSLAAWRNYGGSKTWPAPQGWQSEDQWPGPPDPVLDTGPYQVDGVAVECERATARVRSPQDSRTGVQIKRELSLYPGGTHAQLHLEMCNTSSRPRRWSLWEVVQIDAARFGSDGREEPDDRVWLAVPLNPRSCFERGYTVLYGEPANPQWQPDYQAGLMIVRYQYRVGKIGLDSNGGWVAVGAGGSDHVLCLRFDYQPTETYPDGGTSVACWTTGLGAPVGNLNYAANPLYHIECEVLGPLRTMAPGAAQTLDIDWYTARCPGPVCHVSEVGCCGQRLTCAPQTEGVHLRGTYGVFYQGQLELAWIDDRGGVLQRQVLGAADPRQPVVLDCVSRVPAQARAAEIRLHDNDGQYLGQLDRVTL